MLTPKQIRNNLWAIIEDIDHGNYLANAEPHVVNDAKEALEAVCDMQEYLDRCIMFWRKDKHDYAKYYIDAFQSIRTSIFGEVLK